MTKEPWHLSKSVPVSLIFAIVLQAAAIVAAGTAMRGDIDVNRDDIDRNVTDIALAAKRFETKSEDFETSIQAQAILLARMDENLKAIRQALEKLAQ